MSNPIEFDTPENVRIQYQQAGLGTRFVAWITDQLLLLIIMIALLITLMILGAVNSAILDAIPPGFSISDETDFDLQYKLYFLGIFMLILGLGSFIYYEFFELLMRGQTPGKRSVKIRVVKVDGFALDFASVTIRNIFRIIDHVPVVWIVPLLSTRSQRLGDMVAGTMLIHELETPLDAMRSALTEQHPSQALFRFEGKTGRIDPKQVYTIEEIVKRAKASGPEKCQDPIRIATEALATKLDMENPSAELRMQFLEEFLTMEYHRQSRRMG